MSFRTKRSRGVRNLARCFAIQGFGFLAAFGMTGIAQELRKGRPRIWYGAGPARGMGPCPCNPHRPFCPDATLPAFPFVAYCWGRYPTSTGIHVPLPLHSFLPESPLWLRVGLGRPPPNLRLPHFHQTDPLPLELRRRSRSTRLPVSPPSPFLAG